ncbi:MAG: DNA alkylation repair protein [Clostridia bacterium]|nr:DNA alkylation repair protein [Clostridia bacterium]
MEYDVVIGRLEALSDPEAVKGMARYGIVGNKVYGVSIPNLRQIAREIGVDHGLALRLWAADSRETRILASMVADPKLVTETQMEEWVQGFDSWDLCNQYCMNLFEKTRFAYQKCFDWSCREEEFVKRAGFVLMARLAVSNKKADDARFEQFLPIIGEKPGILGISSRRRSTGP